MGMDLKKSFSIIIQVIKLTCKTIVKLTKSKITSKEIDRINQEKPISNYNCLHQHPGHE